MPKGSERALPGDDRNCPYCGRATKHRNGRKPGDPIPRAVLADGTCERCWRTKLHLSQNKKEGATMDAHAVDHDREGLEAYFRERRGRGVDPEGNPDLDKQFWRDVYAGTFAVPNHISPFRKHAREK